MSRGLIYRVYDLLDTFLEFFLSLMRTCESGCISTYDCEVSRVVDGNAQLSEAFIDPSVWKQREAFHYARFTR